MARQTGKQTSFEKQARRKKRREKRGKFFVWVMLIAIAGSVLLSVGYALLGYFGIL
ncbi:Protein of unknown function [Aerococcus urinaehominis]|uniref:DUF4044 domain-containing protein n=1 Tax=Aerococcus urinaehominis TaxID=128944 RepID=UPI00088FC8AE|nr:DUF4044 domain-containing protein [Aerococcus urinaehominis]SDL90271.1 Protein of unknown function [Aerococcus urinaehominis]